MASFQESGKWPVVSDRLISLVIEGRSSQQLMWLGSGQVDRTFFFSR